jgi:argininosuccinate lyase
MAEHREKGWGYFYRNAAGRMAEDPAPEMTAMRDEFIPLGGIHAFDKAHAVMLVEEGIISRETGTRILRALMEMEREGFESVREKTGGGGHSGEAYLIEKCGMEIGGQLHIGRSSADLIGVAVRMEEREAILKILQGISSLCLTLLQAGELHLHTILPLYTHFQQAQPITLAHHLLSWVFSLGRDIDRFLELYERVNASPAGAAIGSGSPFPINRARVAELLGFDSLLQNTRDAVFGYDTQLELFTDVAVLDNTLARLCSDLYIWCSSEFSLVELKDRYCGTSSINPNKKNPQALEQIFSLAASATGAMGTAFAVDRMPSDAWEIQWRVWSQGLWPLLGKTIQALILVESVWSTLEVNRGRMAELAGSGWICASDLAALLVDAGKLPWRVAHQTVGQLVRACGEKGGGPKEVTSRALDEAAMACIGKPLSLSQDLIVQALDPLQCVKARHVTGGPAPEEVKKQIEECLSHSRRWDITTEGKQESLARANRMLQDAIQSILQQQPDEVGHV